MHDLICDCSYRAGGGEYNLLTDPTGKRHFPQGYTKRLGRQTSTRNPGKPS